MIGPFVPKNRNHHWWCVALFMNGAQGGMVTADTRLEYGKEGDGQKEANTWEECIRIGELLAGEAMRIVAAAPVLMLTQHFIAPQEILEFPIDSEIMRYILKKSPLKYEGGKENYVTTQLNLLKYWARSNLNCSRRGTCLMWVIM
jgi:hypothetical protein